MKKLTPLALLMCLGCASQRTTLTERIEADGASVKTTEIRTRTFFDSKNELTKLKTSSTDKTQSVGIDGLKQESSGSNAVQVLRIVVEAAAAGAAKAAVPVP